MPLRLAAVSLARRGGAALVASAFLVVSVGVALFVVSYRATLERGQRDQAAFAVPADYVLAEDLERLVTVQQVESSAFAQLGDAAGVARASGDLRGRAVTLLGVPERSLGEVHGWRDRPSTSELRALGPTERLRGLDVQPGLFELPVTVRGGPVTMALNVLKPGGDFAVVPLGTVETGAHVLHARVPAGRIVALRLSYPPVAAFLAGHRESGTTLSVSNASRGVLKLGPPFSAWIGTGGTRVMDGEVHYLVNRAAVSLLRPRQPTDGVPVPVLATPSLAALGDVLSLTVNDAPVTVRVVGVTSFVPSVSGDAIVADRDRVVTAVNTARPGAVVPNEVWVLRASPNAPALLQRDPLDRLAVTSHAERLHDLRSDPLARGTLAILSITALVAVVLALVGLLLTVATDVRDESGELFDLRAQGATPAELRRYLRVRAALVAIAGVVGGLVAGAILVTLVSAVVSVTAGATTPLPPLVVSIDWPLLALGLVGFAVAAAALVRGATTRMPA
jgi:hypothetical protein